MSRDTDETGVSALADNDNRLGAQTTRQFVDGYNLSWPSIFGTAWVPRSCPFGGTWTAADVYHVSWEAAAQWPMPEIYTSAGVDSWISIQQSWNMGPMGTTEECPGADPISENTMCYVPKNGQLEYSPDMGWNAYRFALQAGWPERLPTLDYTTDIRYQ